MPQEVPDRDDLGPVFEEIARQTYAANYGNSP